jgi:hypothetical protein
VLQGLGNGYPGVGGLWGCSVSACMARCMSLPIFQLVPGDNCCLAAVWVLAVN